MKRILLVFIAGLLAAVSFGQTQLENPGFEGAWETTGVSGAQPEPEDWSSLKSADALATLAPIVAFQESTNPHSGTYCIRLLVVNSFGVNAAGLLTNGRVHADFDPELGYVWTETGDAKWNTPFNDRPDSLTFWVKHAPITGDQSKVMVILHDNSLTGQLPHTGDYSHWVAQAREDITSTYASWERISVPFTYYNNSIPDYVIVSMSAGDSTVAAEDTEMWIDDLELIYNPLSTSIDPAAQQNIDICTNGGTLTITESTNAAVITPPTREWKWSNTPGGPYSSFGTPETGTTYTPNFSVIDSYYIICETDYGTQGMVTSNEVEIVTIDPGVNIVSIAPVPTQNLNANQDGNVLSAIECPTSTSREWMWTTTSGSGYASFTSAETATTYTPNFAAAGTYYVICESDFAGDIQNSNEVTVIVVEEGTGIDEQGVSYNIFSNGSAVNVILSSLNSTANFKLYTLDGKLVYTSILNNASTQHIIDATSGIYIYQVVTADRIVTGKIKL